MQRQNHRIEENQHLLEGLLEEEEELQEINRELAQLQKHYQPTQTVRTIMH